MLEPSYPTIKREIKAFVGITGYYHRFIERYVMIAKPISRVLKDNAPPLQVASDALEAFEKLK